MSKKSFSYPQVKINYYLFLRWVQKWVQAARNVDLTVKCCSQKVGAKWVRGDFVDFYHFKITNLFFLVFLPSFNLWRFFCSIIFLEN